MRTDKMNARKECPLNYYVSFNGGIIKKATGISLHVRDWDGVKQKIRSNASVKVKNYDNKIGQRMTDFNNYILNLSISNKAINRTAIDDFFDDNVSKDFYKFYDNFVSYNSKKKVKPWADSTIGKYKNSLVVFKEFLKKRKALDFGDISLKMILDFDAYLYKKELHINTVYNYHKSLRVVMKEALKLKLMTTIPYFFFEPPKGEIKTERIPLTKNEVVSIANLKLGEEHKALGLYKDFLLFYCYTGCRFQEIFSIEKTGFTKTEFKYIDAKDKTIKVKPLNKEAWRIIIKYNARSKTNLVFPKRANPTVNKKIKEVAKLAKIDKHIITHLGRHTLATNMRANGAKMEDIASVLGQKKVDTTKLYAKPSKKILLEAVTGLYSSKEVA